MEIKLSYSSWSQLQTCEQQYVHRKVLKTPVDCEEQDRTAFDVGSAVHFCMEETMWGKNPISSNLINKAIEQYKDAAPFKGLVHAMALALVKQQVASGLTCVKAELTLDHPKFIGYVDMVAKNSRDEWFIVDLKTSASKPNDGLVARLPLDRQLNLYTHFRENIATALELDTKLFKGCIYRVVTKSKANQKDSEEYARFVKRVERLTKVYDIFIPFEMMNPDQIWEDFCDAYVKTLSLHEGEVPRKNLGACFNYFRTCEYFSQCHGKKAEDLVKELKVKTNLDYQKELEDLDYL